MESYLSKNAFPVNFAVFLEHVSFKTSGNESCCFAVNLQCVELITASIYLLKVNNRNTRTSCEIYSKLTIKTPERPHWRCSGVFIVNFERNFSSCSSISIVNFAQVIAGWDVIMTANIYFQTSFKKLSSYPVGVIKNVDRMSVIIHLEEFNNC